MALAAMGAMRMAVLIRTSDVPAAHRYDAWPSIVCDTLGPLDFRSDPDVPLSGAIEAGHLGPVNVGRVQTSTPHSVLRRYRSSLGNELCSMRGSRDIPMAADAAGERRSRQ